MKISRVASTFVCTNFLLLFSNVYATAETVPINLRDYLYQSPANNNMLCQSDLKLCSKGFVTPQQEFANIYTNGINYYTARSNTSPYYIGVMRYVDPTDPDPNQRQLRCFAQTNSFCSAPPSVAYPPQSAPQIFYANVAAPTDELASDNSNGSPRQPIRGATSLTNGTVYFALNALNPNGCAQTRLGTGNMGHEVLAVFIRQFYFGGDLGYKDTLIIDEYETGPTIDTYHMERYYYVNGYGRVREGASFYTQATGVYDRPTSYSLKNLLRPNTISLPANPCPQGSAPLQ